MRLSAPGRTWFEHAAPHRSLRHGCLPRRVIPAVLNTCLMIIGLYCYRVAERARSMRLRLGGVFAIKLHSALGANRRIGAERGTHPSSLARNHSLDFFFFASRLQLLSVVLREAYTQTRNDAFRFCASRESFVAITRLDSSARNPDQLAGNREARGRETLTKHHHGHGRLGEWARWRYVGTK